MNNKYSYRLVDILKGGADENRLVPSRQGIAARKRSKQIGKTEGSLSLYIFIFQLCDGVAARPRCCIASIAQQCDQSIAIVTDEHQALDLSRVCSGIDEALMQSYQHRCEV